jgi:hypothetical protein
MPRWIDRLANVMLILLGLSVVVRALSLEAALVLLGSAVLLAGIVFAASIVRIIGRMKEQG